MVKSVQLVKSVKSVNRWNWWNWWTLCTENQNLGQFTFSRRLAGWM